MANGDLVTQHRLGEIVGTARLQRWLRSHWLIPTQRTDYSILFSLADVRACLRRLERGEICPPDQIESARTNGSAIRHGRGYVKKGRPQRPGLDAIKLDFSALTSDPK